MRIHGLMVLGIIIIGMAAERPASACYSCSSSKQCEFGFCCFWHCISDELDSCLPVREGCSIVSTEGYESPPLLAEFVSQAFSEPDAPPAYFAIFVLSPLTGQSDDALFKDHRTRVIPTRESAGHGVYAMIEALASAAQLSTDTFQPAKAITMRGAGPIQHDFGLDGQPSLRVSVTPEIAGGHASVGIVNLRGAATSAVTVRLAPGVLLLTRVVLGGMPHAIVVAARSFENSELGIGRMETLSAAVRANTDSYVGAWRPHGGLRLEASTQTPAANPATWGHLKVLYR